MLVVLEDKRLPLVITGWLSLGRCSRSCGLARADGDVFGLTDGSTESLASRQIADEVGRMGATLTAGANSDYTTVAASSLTDFNDKILDLLADITLHPSFPANEVELIKQNTKESLRQQRAQPSFLVTEMVSRVIFGEHPYSVIAPTIESIDRVTRERLIEIHRAKFVPNNAVLVVAGDVNPDQLLPRMKLVW